MLALANPFSRLGYGSTLSRYVKEFLRTRTYVREFGADKFFLEHAARIGSWYERIAVSGCDGTEWIPACKRCHTTNVLTFPYDRAVFRGSVMGRRYGTMHYRVPVCTRCDTSPTSAELIAPIIVYRGKRRDGFTDIPEQVMQLLSIHVDLDPST